MTVCELGERKWKSPWAGTQTRVAQYVSADSILCVHRSYPVWVL